MYEFLCYDKNVTIIPAALTITTQQVSKSGKVGDTVQFTVKATGAGLKYQWYFSNDDGTTWAKYSSKQTLNITLKKGMNGRLFRCVITDANGKTLTSRTVSLTVR